MSEKKLERFNPRLKQGEKPITKKKKKKPNQKYTLDIWIHDTRDDLLVNLQERGI